MRARACVYVRVYVCVWLRVRACAWLCACVSVCECVCVYGRSRLVGRERLARMTPWPHLLGSMHTSPPDRPPRPPPPWRVRALTPAAPQSLATPNAAEPDDHTERFLAAARQCMTSETPSLPSSAVDPPAADGSQALRPDAVSDAATHERESHHAGRPSFCAGFLSSQAAVALAPRCGLTTTPPRPSGQSSWDWGGDSGGDWHDSSDDWGFERHIDSAGDVHLSGSSSSHAAGGDWAGDAWHAAGSSSCHEAAPEPEPESEGKGKNKGGASVASALKDAGVKNADRGGKKRDAWRQFFAWRNDPNQHKKARKQ